MLPSPLGCPSGPHPALAVSTLPGDGRLDRTNAVRFLMLSAARTTPNALISDVLCDFRQECRD